MLVRLPPMDPRTILIALVVGVTSTACGGRAGESTTPTDETYTTSGDDELDDDPPEPDYEDPQ